MGYLSTMTMIESGADRQILLRWHLQSIVAVGRCRMSGQYPGGLKEVILRSRVSEHGRLFVHPARSARPLSIRFVCVMLNSGVWSSSPWPRP